MLAISLKKLIAAALVAALIGSTIGTILLCVDEITVHPIRRLMGQRFGFNPDPLYMYFLMFPVVWTISLLGTVPGSLLLGTPAIYPLRNVIARSPVKLAIPVMIYAVLLATLLLGWTITPDASGKRTYDTIWFYSAATALGFVMAIGWLFRPKKDHPIT